MGRSTVRISIVVIVYRMRDQAMNTLSSLAPDYQQGVADADYEVVVVENDSDDPLDPDQVKLLGQNFRYYRRNEPGVSPAPAINFGLERCEGDVIGLLIDGARMLTPRVLQWTMAAFRGGSAPLVVIPGYHIGAEHHHSLNNSEGLKRDQQRYLRELDWRENGYRLFEDACFSEGNRRGYFHPLMEANTFFCRRELLESIGGADERFDQLGGGSLNLHMYRSLAMQPDTPLIILPGEGNFHQLHGGVTTSPNFERSDVLKSFRDRVDRYWGGRWKAPTRQPLFLGPIASEAQAFLEQSCELGIQRFARFRRTKCSPWPDDDALGISHNEEFSP